MTHVTTFKCVFELSLFAKLLRDKQLVLRDSFINEQDENLGTGDSRAFIYSAISKS